MAKCNFSSFPSLASEKAKNSVRGRYRSMAVMTSSVVLSDAVNTLFHVSVTSMDTDDGGRRTAEGCSFFK